jgi:hypothetical protein
VVGTVITLLVIVVVILLIVVLVSRTTGASLPIRNGVRGEAIIEAYRDTGMYERGTGNFGSVYQLKLLVTPVGGGAPVMVEIKSTIDSIVDPTIGARVPVIISPTNPKRVKVDHKRTLPPDDKGWHTTNDHPEMDDPDLADLAAAAGPGAFDVGFDASGQPSAGDVAALAGGVRSGAVKQIHGSAAQLLATGLRGTAVITTAQPMGKTVRDVNPRADASHLNDPMWLFTVEVTVFGKPFPAVFGHRVPPDKVASVAPGVKLAVAVDMADHNKVAIDWDKSPIVG